MRSLRLYLQNKTPFFGNDDDKADSLMQRIYASLFDAIDGKPNTKGRRLPPEYALRPPATSTSERCWGDAQRQVSGKTHIRWDLAFSRCRSHGPTAVIKSLGKMDQIKSGGTLLNQRFLPDVLENEGGPHQAGASHSILFQLDGHHIQFNIVDIDTPKSPGCTRRIPQSPCTCSRIQRLLR